MHIHQALSIVLSMERAKLNKSKSLPSPLYPPTIGWIMALKDVLIYRTSEYVTTCGKRVFAEVIKLRILIWEMILGWRGSPKCNHEDLYKREAGLPWWHSGWESACQCRGHGFEPWSGRIPHAAEQLGPWATTTEPARLEPVPRNKRGGDSERPVHCDEEWPPLAATRESPRTETKTQHSQK